MSDNVPNSHRVAILFRTNLFEKLHESILDKIIGTSGLPVFVITDESAGFVEVGDKYQKISIKREDLINMGLINLDEWGWRCGDYFLIMARNELKEFDYFWMIEPDVFIDFDQCSDFFGKFSDGDDVDLWVAELRTNDASWFWHNGMAKYHSGPVSRCLYPLLRISARLIDAIANRRKEIRELLKIADLSMVIAVPPSDYPNDEAITATLACSPPFNARDFSEIGDLYSHETYRFGWPLSRSQLENGSQTKKLYHPALSGEHFLLRLYKFLEHDLRVGATFDHVLHHYSKPKLIEAIILEVGPDGLRQFVEKRDSILAKIAEKKTTNVREKFIRKIWRGIEPFSSQNIANLKPDLQGWHSDHRYLSESIGKNEPFIIVEVGVWKGMSSIFMANMLKKLNINGIVISVDTWLGSWDHWENDEWFSHLKLDRGFPSIFETFLANVIHSDVQNFIVPLPLDSINAAHVIKHYDIRPNIIHIDGGHDYRAVKSDLEAWWPLLSPGGVLIGDDYNTDGQWPDVQRAFDDFRSVTPHDFFEHENSKCRMKKSAQ